MVWNHLICRLMSIAIRIHAVTSGKCNESHLQHLSECNGSDAECFLFRVSLLMLSDEASLVLLLVETVKEWRDGSCFLYRLC